MLIFITFHLSFKYHAIYYTNTISNQITGIYFPHKIALYNNTSSLIYHQWLSRFCKNAVSKVGCTSTFDLRPNNMLYGGPQPRKILILLMGHYANLIFFTLSINLFTEVVLVCHCHYFKRTQVLISDNICAWNWTYSCHGEINKANLLNYTYCQRLFFFSLRLSITLINRERERERKSRNWSLKLWPYK